MTEPANQAVFVRAASQDAGEVLRWDLAQHDAALGDGANAVPDLRPGLNRAVLNFIPPSVG